MDRYYYATGKRKTSIAKVRLVPTKKDAEILINETPLKEYFILSEQRETVVAPLKLVGMEKALNASIVVRGGGPTGQCEAIRHGISRALLEIDPMLRPTLKKAGFLTRDPRVKERKKPGLHRARRAPQFAKR